MKFEFFFAERGVWEKPEILSFLGSEVSKKQLILQKMLKKCGFGSGTARGRLGARGQLGGGSGAARGRLGDGSGQFAGVFFFVKNCQNANFTNKLSKIACFS